MKIDFRIDWGYHYLYSRRHYHPTYIWDGSLTCSDGEIKEIFKLDYPYCWFGIPHSAKEEKLDKPEWKDTTKRGLSGIRVVAEVSDTTVFKLECVSAKVEFKACDILEKGRLEFPVGPKYLGCFVTVTQTGYLWYRPELKEGHTAFEYDSLGLEVHDWARMNLAWLSPDANAVWEADIRENNADYTETVFRIICMGVPEYSEKETPVMGTIPMELYCDGECVKRFKHFFRPHDTTIQILDDVWVRAQIKPGHHKFELKNKNGEFGVGINRLIMFDSLHNHGDLSIPEWCLTGEKIYGRVFFAFPDELTVKTNDEIYKIKGETGWGEFEFSPAEGGMKTFECMSKSATIEVFDCEKENPPFKVGYCDCQIPKDDSKELDWIIDYAQRTRLGNIAHFSCGKKEPCDPTENVKRAKLLNKYGIYLSISRCVNDEAMLKEAGEYALDCGSGEYPGVVYCKNPKEGYMSTDMKEAAEKYIAFLKKDVEKTPREKNHIGFVDASGGVRYSFIAGADCVKMETMVAHTQTMLSQVRPAAEALTDGRCWMAHIAIQHAYVPYRITHVNQYFLCLMQPWIMGAEGVYDEDSLFGIWTEERQVWDDYIPQKRRDMTRKFYKFTATHPRKGKCVRNIAFIEGRYAAPFNGFICGTEQDPHYSVWGLFGNDAPEWGHGQPEKCRQLLDVLMPGASTHPLRQKFDKRRFYFSGTPYGDFDCVPIEAKAEYLDNYKLLLNLGWNTIIKEDYEKLKSFVYNGGVLLSGITQFSTHTKREFLKDMKDLALMNNGDLSELCGIKVNGRGEAYSGQWNCSDFDKIETPELSALPSDFPAEDGEPYLADVELSGAEVVAYDAFSGKPMLVKYNYGKGSVYTFTIWAYPGHEQFQSFCASWVGELSRQNMSDIYVTDDSKEVFWTVWEDGQTRYVKLLNTDWTVPGNVKNVTLSANGRFSEIAVKEGSLVIAEVCGDNVSVKEYIL